MSEETRAGAYASYLAHIHENLTRTESAVEWLETQINDPEVPTDLKIKYLEVELALNLRAVAVRNLVATLCDTDDRLRAYLSKDITHP